MAILLAAFAFGTKSFSLKLVLIVLVISGGVGLASYGEVKFNWTGVTIQMVAIAIEATRVTLIQILLQGSSMSPLLSLYYFAPICLSLNAAMIIPIEGWAAIRAVPALGFFTILSNCTLTFLLNLSAVYLICELLVSILPTVMSISSPELRGCSGHGPRRGTEARSEPSLTRVNTHSRIKYGALPQQGCEGRAARRRLSSPPRR